MDIYGSSRYDLEYFNYQFKSRFSSKSGRGGGGTGGGSKGREGIGGGKRSKNFVDGYHSGSKEEGLLGGWRGLGGGNIKVGISRHSRLSIPQLLLIEIVLCRW